MLVYKAFKNVNFCFLEENNVVPKPEKNKFCVCWSLYFWILLLFSDWHFGLSNHDTFSDICLFILE